MDPSTDQPKHEVDDVSSDPQQSLASVVQSDEQLIPSCDSVETNPDLGSEPIGAPAVVDTIDEAPSGPSHPPGLPPKSEQLQAAEDAQVAQQLKFGPYSNRYYPQHQSYRLSREVLREIAASTLDVLDDGFYYPPSTHVTDQVEVEREAEENGGKEVDSEEIKDVESKEGDEKEGKEVEFEEVKDPESKEGEKEGREVESEEVKEQESKGGDKNEGKGVESEEVKEQESKGGDKNEGKGVESEEVKEQESKGGDENEGKGVESEEAKEQESKGGDENEGKGVESEEVKEQPQENKDGEGEEGKEVGSEQVQESKKGEGESKKEAEESEPQDGTDEIVHLVESGQRVGSINHRNAGREPYDLKAKMWYTNQHTLFVAPGDETMGLWFQADLPLLKDGEEKKKTRIIIGEYSTLVGSRRLQEMAQDEAEPQGKIGVLNFASAKKPGGGFVNGSQAQEESLARSSTLYASLLTPTALQFYRLYSADPDNPFYTHAMVYSPSVVLFRDDKGDWTAPLEVDILTSAAVNAGDVRKQVKWEEEMRALRERVRVAELARRRELSLPTFVRIYESEPQREDHGTESGQRSLAQSEQPSTGSAQVSPIIFASDPPSPPLEPLSLSPSHLISPLSQILGTTSTSQNETPSSSHPHAPNVDPLTYIENVIAAAMYERIARTLYLFHLQGARHLVLGSFGTGVFQNSVELIAGIFRNLLCDSKEEDELEEKGKEEEKEGAKDDDERVEGEGPRFANINSQCRGKFKDVFDTVMFAILGGSTVKTFSDVFEGAEGVEFDEGADGSDVEGMKDAGDVRAQDREEPPPPA